MSMETRSTPHLPPFVAIHSPGSPPKTNPGSRNGSRSPERLLSAITAGKIPSFRVQAAQRDASSPKQEPSTDAQDERHEKLSGVDAGSISSSSLPRTSSLPPAVNRAEKPKIPAKPKPPQSYESRKLTPEPVERPENRVSPFSTPPSSEGSPSPERQHFVTTNSLPGRMGDPLHANGNPSSRSSREQGHQQRDPRLLGFSSSTGSIEPRDPRSLGLNSNATASPIGSRGFRSAPAKTVPDRFSTSQPTTVYQRDSAYTSQNSAPRRIPTQSKAPSPSTISTRPSSSSSASQRDPRQIVVSNPNTNRLQVEGPSRRAPPLLPPEGLKTQLSGGNSVRQPQPVDRSTKPSTIARNQPFPSVDSRSEFQPPPRRTTREGETTQDLMSAMPRVANAHAGKDARRKAPEDSDEAEELELDLPVTRAEYPDSSQANRRPPHFNQGPQEIPTKFDSRVFDMCGQYVCTTGYVTRLWDLSRGEQVFSLSHGETVKMSSLVFKPAETLEEEGSRVWVGSSIGEIHEIDFAARAIVATSAVHNRREVVRILRHKKDLWTLDDEGKLFVWRAEDFRTPSLKSSHHSHRVPKGHTFSMAVQDMLWYATGREIRVFRPGNDVSFSVLQKPLSQSGTGEITSGTYTSRQGGRVYVGHTDGRVTIYSTKDYSCIEVTKASDYKINSMSFVGEHLWTAYKTGKIYVYDTSSTPWKVKKDWRAHDGPTASLLLDVSSAWMLDRLQVASLGHDHCIRLWDGILEEDWLETAMQSSDVKYCTFREIRAAVVTWNVGACNPLDIRGDFIRDAIHVEDPPELLVFGFQEIVDLEDRAVTAKSILGFGKKKDKENARSEQHVSRVYREWRDYLGKCINRYVDPRFSYTEVHTSCLIGLFQCVFVRQEEEGGIRNMSATEVKCGMKGHYGNKGALITRFMIDDSSLCFINCHLAAGQMQTSHRNNDIAAILEAESLPAEHDPRTRTSFYVGGGDGTQVLDHEICILNGDLNYRIDAIPRDTVVSMVNKGELGKLLERDQIMISRRRVSGFRLSPFNEAPITFAPTYKYDVGSDSYDTSEKKRSPAWCDRLLYRGVGRIKQMEYRRHEVRASDHRPVSGIFRIRLKTIDPGRQEEIRAECNRAFHQVRDRLADEAR